MPNYQLSRVPQCCVSDISHSHYHAQHKLAGMLNGVQRVLRFSQMARLVSSLQPVSLLNCTDGIWNHSTQHAWMVLCLSLPLPKKARIDNQRTKQSIAFSEVTELPLWKQQCFCNSYVLLSPQAPVSSLSAAVHWKRPSFPVFKCSCSLLTKHPEVASAGMSGS